VPRDVPNVERWPKAPGLRQNGQPAVGIYRRRGGEEDYRPLAIDVLRIADGVVAEILTLVPGQFAALDLPGPPC
jgi:RNA polymerase sigma-70 factor (ECF subfamily)